MFIFIFDQEGERGVGGGGGEGDYSLVNRTGNTRVKATTKINGHQDKRNVTQTVL